MKILSLNSGSSSIKYHLFDMIGEQCLVSGIVERIGENGSAHHYLVHSSDGDPKTYEIDMEIHNHGDGLKSVYNALVQSQQIKNARDLYAIGHRVVHGGPRFDKPCLIDHQAIEAIRACASLAPLHNPVNLLGIEFSLKTFTGVPQVAVFDTSFHRTIPIHARQYAIPGKIADEYSIQRYGFHGTSNQYLVRLASEHLAIEKNYLNAIILHLGNGASVTAIQSGASIDTSMGFTPLEGLVMGTRCGDLDPAIIFYLHRKTGMSNDELEAILNEQSGLQGICEHSDMRDVRKAANAGEQSAKLAQEMYVYRIKKYIGAYYAILGRIDALIFSAGVGEHDAWIREQICSELDHLNIAIDSTRNMNSFPPVCEIQSEENPVKILVMATNEELEIARQTRELVAARVR